MKHKLKTESPSDVHTFIADGIFIVRLSNNLKSVTFSSFPRSILTKLLKCTKYCLDLCFDVYESPSIKYVKRKAQGDNEVDCYFGPKQSLLTGFEALLQISEYKLQFLRTRMKFIVKLLVRKFFIVPLIMSAKDFIVKMIITKLS